MGEATNCVYGDRFQEGCCHEWKVRCEAPDVGPQVVDQAACKGCSSRWDLANVTIGAVVTARNEGEEVQLTIESLANSVQRAKLVVIVVDDGSTDGSCERLHVPRGELVVHRNGKPHGVGRSRNLGADLALGRPASVVTFHDAHMRFPVGVLEALAARALRQQAIVTSKAKGWWKPDGREDDFRAWGADLHWNSRDGLQPKYRIYCEGQPEWIRVPCPMGACYVVSRGTAEALSAPTGRLWEDTAGLWGFSEQALAVKAFLLAIPVLVSRDLATHHHYRGSNPLPDASREAWKNCCISMARQLSAGAFDLRFRDYCEARLGKEDVGALLRRLGDAREAGHVYEERIFTHLCGRGTPITSQHTDHTWLDALENHVGGNPGIRRVLQWRPGESTLLLHGWLPSADIRCLEWVQRRVLDWAPICKRLRVALTQLRLEDWTDPIRSGHIRPDERFDLITVGGELQAECMAAAKRLLAPGGAIIVNPSADAHVVEDAVRHEVTKQLEEFQAKSAGPALHTPAGAAARGRSAGASSGGAGSPVTVLLLNWQRPENIGPILDALRRQTVRPRVMVWDNGAAQATPLRVQTPEGLELIEALAEVDLAVRPGANLGCLPRWLLAPYAETEFVCCLDDDLMPGDERVLEDCIEAHRSLCPEGIVGSFGWQAVVGKDYRHARHFNGPPKRDGAFEDRRCDLIKGRFMLLPTRLLARVPLRHPALEGVAEARDMLFRADDVYVSLCVSQGRPDWHLVPGVLGRRMREVGRQDGRALASNAGHYAMRGRLVELLRDWYRTRAREAA